MNANESQRWAPPKYTTRKRLILPAIVFIIFFSLNISGALNKSWHHWLYIFVFAWALSNLLTPLAIRFSFILGWLDIPHGRKAHEHPTPTLGGAAIIGSFGIALLTNFHFSFAMKGIGLASLLIWIVGVLDDRFELPAIIKLLAQILATVILIVFGVQVTFMPNVWWGYLAEYIITAFWIIGITNAVNYLDGLDGLAAGMSSIICIFLAIVAIQTGQSYFGLVALALLGACLGFLPYNIHYKKSADVFLGDNGATFLGFALAATATMGDWAEDNLAAIIVPILLFGVPIFDMTLTTITRIATGKVKSFGQWLAYTGRDHFHHRLAALGVGNYIAVIVIYVVTFFLGISAIVLKQARGVDAVLLLVQSGILFLLIIFFMLYVQPRQIRVEIKSVTDDSLQDLEKSEE